MWSEGGGRGRDLTFKVSHMGVYFSFTREKLREQRQGGAREGGSGGR